MNSRVNLLKGSNQHTSETSSKYMDAQRFMINICNELSKESMHYNPNNTKEIINRYIQSENKIDRLFYSEISSYMFSLNQEKQGIFSTNLDKLIEEVLSNESECDKNCEKIVLKIYDHAQLALSQIDKVNKVLASGIADTKIDLQESIKTIEKDHITILGIFSAIVIAFTGGIAFSSSVLKCMSDISIYRLLLITDLLGFILINTLYVLIKLIAIVNKQDLSLFQIKTINISFIVITITILAAWVLSIHLIPSRVNIFK